MDGNSRTGIKEDGRAPHHAPGDIDKERGGRREDGERRIREVLREIRTWRALPAREVQIRTAAGMAEGFPVRRMPTRTDTMMETPTTTHLRS